MEKIKVIIDVPVNKLEQLRFIIADEEETTPDKKLAEAMNPDCPFAAPAEEAPKTVAIDKTALRALGVELTKAGKQEELAAALEKFGAKKLSEVKEEDYEALYKELGGK